MLRASKISELLGGLVELCDALRFGQVEHELGVVTPLLATSGGIQPTDFRTRTKPYIGMAWGW